MKNLDKRRFAWVDIMKFIGIFAIYLGHMEGLVGRAFPYVYTFHVPLFFFTAGFFALKGTEQNFGAYVWGKVKTLLFPYYFFTIIYLLILIVKDRPTGTRLMLLIQNTVTGLKGATPTGGRWFLTCLFVVTLLFYMLHKLINFPPARLRGIRPNERPKGRGIRPLWRDSLPLYHVEQVGPASRWFKKPSVLIIISLLIYLITQTILPHNPLATPLWFYNLDLALCYLFYYVLGFALFPVIVRLLGKVKKSALFAGGFCAFSPLVFFLSAQIFLQKPSPFSTVSGLGGRVISLALPVIYAFIGILAVFYISLILEKIPLLSALGKESLLLCCNETLYRSLLFIALGMAGLEIGEFKPLYIGLLTGLLIVFGHYVVHPLQIRFFQLMGIDTFTPAPKSG